MFSITEDTRGRAAALVAGRHADLLPAGFPRPFVLCTTQGETKIPGDLPALLDGLSLGHAAPVMVLASAGIETTRDLLRLDQQALRFCPGIGQARADKIAAFVRQRYGIDWPPKGSKSLRHQLAREAFDLALDSA